MQGERQRAQTAQTQYSTISTQTHESMKEDSTYNRIVIVAHQPLATALREVTAHVYPTAERDIITLDVGAADTLPEALLKLETTLSQRASGRDNLLFFTDLPGATPHNTVIRFTEQQLHNPAYRCAWISGVSAPMLVRAWNYRDLPFAELCHCALTAAARCVLSSVPADEQQADG